MTFRKIIKAYENHYIDWLEDHKAKLTSKKRCLPTAIISAQVFEEVNNEGLVFGKATLWLFGIDRWFDEQNEPYKKLIDRCTTVLRQSFSSKRINLPQDSEARELIYLMENLLSVLNIKKYGRAWELVFMNTLYQVILTGMAFEYMNKGKNITIPEEEYLYYGRESIGVKFVNLCVLFSQNIKLAVEHDYYLSQIQNLSAEIIRLMNDKITYQKELLEGNNNYITAIGYNESEASKNLERLINKRLKSLRSLTKSGPHELGDFSNYVLGLTETTLDFYSRSDFYDSLSKLNKEYH